MSHQVVKTPDGGSIVFIDLWQSVPVGYEADIQDERWPDPTALVASAFKQNGHKVEYRFTPTEHSIRSIQYAHLNRVTGEAEVEHVETAFCAMNRGEYTLVATIPNWRNRPLFITKVENR